MAATDKTVKALMGFLYGALTDGGDGAVQQNERERFICWCLPGIPFDPEELRFNIRGLTGDGNTEAEAGEDTAMLLGQASRFARLVDFTPDATAVFEEQNQMAAFEHGENSLARLYERVLTHSLVASSELTAEEKEKVERITNALYPLVDVVSLTGPPEKRHVEGPLLTTYKECGKTYNQAVNEYNQAWLKSQNPSTPEDALQMTVNGEMLTAQRDAAWAEWETKGRKSEIEAAQAYVAAVTERDLNLWREALKSRFRTSRKADAFGQEFFITSMVPGDFMNNGAGWSNFSFSHKYVDHFESHKATQWETEASLKWKLSFSGDASGSTTATRTVDNVDSFELSCEIAQIPLIRAWFDPIFIESKAWKFGPSAFLTELSDGGAPPHGSMVAYPISVIFARDIKINFAELHDETSELTKSIKAGGKASLGVVNLSGSYKRDTQEKQVKSDITANGLEVSGMQILGFRCRLLKKAPDPLPSIESWV